MGMPGGGFSDSPSKASSSKVAPVALLGLFVVIGVALLHALDDTPTATERSLQASQVASEAASEPAPQVSPPTTVLRSPSEVKVLISNGTEVSGVAARYKDVLQPRGYQLGTPNNTTTPSSESSVQFAPGYEAEAKALATSMGLPEDLVKPMTNPAPVTDTQMANVIVVIGDELAKNPPAATSSSSSSNQGGATVIGPLQSGSGQSSSGQSGSGQSSSGQASSDQSAGASSGAQASTNSGGESSSGSTATESR